MWNRACPLCFVKLPRASVLAHSDELVCPSCHTPLEISRPSRVLAATVGLIAAYVAAQIVVLAAPSAAWFTSIVAAVLGYGLGSALVLYFLSDLVVRPKSEPAHFPQTHR